MRRALVLSDERARHPYRASLPRHVRLGRTAQSTERRPWITRQDVKTFGYFYVACFVGTFAYIY